MGILYRVRQVLATVDPRIPHDRVREALQALVTESQQNVTGTVRVKLYKGNVIAAGLKSPVSLYNPDIATMEADPTDAYNQSDATGFIRLNSLRLKVATKVVKARRLAKRRR